MNAVLLCTQLLFPSGKYPTFSLWWGKRDFFFFSFHSDPGFSVTVLLHLFASGLCPLPSPYLIRGSYPLRHYDCFGSGHLTQAGPIRILFWDLFPNSTGEEHLSVFVGRKLKINDLELLVLDLLPLGRTERLRRGRDEMILVSYSLILFLLGLVFSSSL